MYTGAMIFTQLMQQLPWPKFQTCVDRYRGDYQVKTFRCIEHFRIMAFAQFAMVSDVSHAFYMQPCPKKPTPQFLPTHGAKE